MPALELDKLAWPEVEAELAAGRRTVVIAFGATEQHGPHLPLATDALIGDHLAHRVADELDAFVAPTVRVGCSSHHTDFPGTLSLEDGTFHAIVADHVHSLARSGFERIVLIPTHGGNFAPLAAALEKIGAIDGVRIVGLTDLTVLFQVAQLGAEEFGIPLEQGGVHAGEWETSLLLAAYEDLVRMDLAVAGYVGPLQEAVEGMFGGGVKSISENGVVGDPTQASAEHGRRYWRAAVELALEHIEAQSAA
jgi:creatinine amidohydrolase